MSLESVSSSFTPSYVRETTDRRKINNVYGNLDEYKGESQQILSNSSAPSYVRETANRRRINSHFVDLNEQKEEPKPSLKDRIGSIKNEQELELQNSQEIEELAQALEEIENDLSEENLRNLEPIEQGLQNFGEQANEALDEQEARDREQHQILLQEVAQLENEIENLMRENRELDNQINRVGGHVTAAEKDAMRLQQALNDAKKAAKKRKKKALIKELTILIATIALTWGVAGAAAASGSTVKGAVVSKGSGAMLKLTMII